MNIENLDLGCATFEKDLLLRWFLYYMPMGSAGAAESNKATRFEFMRQFPAIYNKLAGEEIVRVIHVSTGQSA